MVIAKVFPEYMIHRATLQWWAAYNLRVEVNNYKEVASAKSNTVGTVGMAALAFTRGQIKYRD